MNISIVSSNFNYKFAPFWGKAGVSGEKTSYSNKKETSYRCFANNIKAYFYSDKNFVDLIDKKNGNIVKGRIFQPAKNTFYMNVNGNCAGLLFSSVCNSTIIGDKYPDYYKNKPYLFINSLESDGLYKGVGSELIKNLVKDSYKRGYEGRVCLNTTTTCKEKGSPIPFYLKLGFECVNSKKQKVIENCISEKQPIPDSCTSVTMFLPKSKINEILS